MKVCAVRRFSSRIKAALSTEMVPPGFQRKDTCRHLSGVGDALIFASFRVNHSALSCHLCSEPLTKLNYNTAVLFVMLCTAALLLQAVCFEAEGNKMKATSSAIIKVRALMMGFLTMLVATLSKKKESICSAAVKDRKCRLCGANLKMKGNLNFKLHGRACGCLFLLKLA